MIGTRFFYFLFALQGFAAEEARDEPVELVYKAPAGCPDEAEFRSEVGQKTSRLRSPLPGEKARSFKVHIAGGRRGTLQIHDLDGEEATRTFQGDSCREVASALALAVAIAVDPSAGLPPPAPAPAEEREPPPVKQEPPPPTTEPAPEKRPAVIPRQAPWKLAVSGEAILVSGVGPFANPGAGGAIEVRPTRGSWRRLSVRLSFQHVASGEQSFVGGDATFSRTMGVLDVCALALSAGPLAFRGCMRAAAGAFRAAGVNLPNPSSEVRAFGAFGPASRIRFTFLAGAFAELGAGFYVPFAQDRFYFRPDTTVYRVPTISPDVGLGLGYEF